MLERSFMMESLITDASIMFAIIAINMTVIGLTSLAESKTIIGVDYGRFLLKKYKLFGYVRIYYLLILFAIINTASIFIVVTSDYTYRLIHFWLLMSSLVFAIYYFFSYIIVENRNIKNKIFEEELLGHYIDSEDVTTYVPDLKTKVSNGTRTKRKIGLNLIRYFDMPNSESDQLFVEAFGPKSVVYNRKLQKKTLKQRGYPNEPYFYREDSSGINDISHEFFQFYRYSQAQDRWLIYLLELFRPQERDRKVSVIYLSNILRVVSQINTFGNSQELFTYKFMSYIKRDIESLYMDYDVGDSEVSWKESMIDELQKQWASYLMKVMSRDTNHQSSAVIEDHIRKIVKQSRNNSFQVETTIKYLYHEWTQSVSTNKEHTEDILFFAIKQYANAKDLDQNNLQLFIESVKRDVKYIYASEDDYAWVRQELFG